MSRCQGWADEAACCSKGSGRLQPQSSKQPCRWFESIRGALSVRARVFRPKALQANAPFPASSARRWAWPLVPSRYEPEDLFRHRSPVDRVMSLEEMEQAIAAALSSPDP
jgi:hypothetical protein